MTNWFLAHWPFAVLALWVGFILVVTKGIKGWDRLWWWRHDQDRTMRRELKK